MAVLVFQIGFALNVRICTLGTGVGTQTAEHFGLVRHIYADAYINFYAELQQGWRLMQVCTAAAS